MKTNNGYEVYDDLDEDGYLVLDLNGFTETAYLTEQDCYIMANYLRDKKKELCKHEETEQVLWQDDPRAVPMKITKCKDCGAFL